ncbi:MAG: beta-lactamase family protein, partial [Acidobacteria bacterium]|nr:beta-lactamase family protein [Acidobacteriota bacterium]
MIHEITQKNTNRNTRKCPSAFRVVSCGFVDLVFPFVGLTAAAPLIALACAVTTLAANLPVAAPSSVGMSAERLAQIDWVVRQSIERRETPGAVVLAARRGRVVWRKAYGARALEPAREAMTADTIFDAASLTKVVATATSVMILVERGLVRLNDPLSKFISEIKGEGRERITIEHL